MTRSACLLALVASAALAAQPTGGLYFPTKVGATWEYDDGRGAKAVTKTVAKAEKTAKGWEVTVRSDTAPAEAGDDRVLVSEKGVFVMGERKERYDPPLCVVKLPVRAGESWDISAPKIAGTGTTAGEEPVDVPAGKYKAVRVDTTMELGGKSVKRSYWYAPGVGLVKAAEDGKAFVTLKKFTPGKD